VVVVGPQDEAIWGEFDVTDDASIVFQNSVHIRFALAIRLERVVMAVDQKKSARNQTRVHRQGFARVEPDQNEALPMGVLGMAFRLNAVEEGFLELEDFFHVHAGNKGLAGRNGGVGEDNILELAGAGRKDRSAFVDLGGIEKVEDRKVLNLKDLVHSLKAKASFPVEEV